MKTTGFQVGRTDALVDAWTRSAPGDPITTDRFRRLVLLDANFDPEGLRLAWDGDRVIGAAYAVRRRVAMVGDDLEPGRGWIPFYFVDPDRRRHGVGKRLLTEAMDWLRSCGRTEVDFSSYTPNYILPGLDADRYPAAKSLMDSLGFRTLYQASAMTLPIGEHLVPDKVRARVTELRTQGYSFSSPSPDELVPLIELANDHFNADWGRVIRETAAAGLPPDRILVARDPGGEIIGWGMCTAYEGIVDRFGPFGVVDRLRGLGLGEALLHLCLERMRALGGQNAWFLWTGEQTPAGHLYRKTGFTVTRRFHIMRAQLTDHKEQS
ncbi:GNAT family N-acetyltransferase [Stackebrandtia nassauensis]|uniref:GCN5-related N-acetyltransferase n=1 Tax=Stackebrandtia nassauensis (strain DSM 44728 / CIP 108903 / NRRL B-16338 / NBRC 102104 / LLR-40K-21) TaxID=446470 RepID=D3Q7G2_STANL|nr:GNAT family N-acetyltransferase [Stackebrandtia nassauensis]ADD42433.1 GCN5-related N-acetyltransferase [Stackebrandtia nassauensis DSM 44728]